MSNRNENISNILEKLREDIETSRKEIQHSIEASETRILVRLESYSQKIADLERENLNLRSKVEYLERESKKNNILIFGLERKPVTFEELKRSIKNLVNVEVDEKDINNFYQLQYTKYKPLKIEFVSYLKKTEILRNCKLLKGKEISILNDLTKTQREENFILRKHLRKARENPDFKSYIKGNKLYVNNKSYRASDLERDEDNIEKRSSAPVSPSIENSKEYSEETSLAQQIDSPRIGKENFEYITKHKGQLNNETGTISINPKQHTRTEESRVKTRFGGKS